MRARIIERGIPRNIEEGRLENVMKIEDVGIKLIASILSLAWYAIRQENRVERRDSLKLN